MAMSSPGTPADHAQPYGQPLHRSSQTAGYPVSSYPTQPAVFFPVPGQGGVIANVHNAMTSIPPDALIEYLRQNAHSVNERGFNGQIPLHRASLSGDPRIVTVLLELGADPNARNNFQETPFHYAAKRGNPQILQKLVDHGADIHVVDQAGRTAMHHAAQGGSIHGLHYLSEVCGLPTHTLDHTLVSPLHMICAHGHVDTLKYILKNERSVVPHQDCGGNNALHVAAKMGYGWSCWKLLEAEGLDLLHVTNKDGHTPLDLAQQGTSFKYKDIVSLLSYHSLIKRKSSVVKGPVLGWYWHLLMPAVVYPLILLFAQVLPMTGVVTTVSMIVFLAVLVQHRHRIHHICGWPNPVWTGTFAAGLFHTLACYLITILPNVYNDHQVAVGLSLALLGPVLFMYYTLLTRDPGVQTHSVEDDDTGKPYTIKDVASGKLTLPAFCTLCEIVPPKRTKHCKLCEQCFVDMDHHCLFLYRCIAKHNHRLFIVFIALVMVSMILFVYIAIVFLREELLYSQLEWELFIHIYNTYPWIWTAIVANALSLIWGFALLRYQLRAVSRGQTTYFETFMSGRSPLTWNQRACNLFRFFTKRRTGPSDSCGAI